MTGKRKVLTRNVFFVGFMGVGKTTVVRKTARVLGLASVDTDMFVERRCGKSPARIFADQGEKAFRKMERRALRDCAAMGPLLISCGEGIVESESNRDFIRENGFVILLSADLGHSESRIRSLRTRPLYAQHDDISGLLAERRPHYEDLADAVIDVSGRSTGWVVGQVERILADAGIYREEGAK